MRNLSGKWLTAAATRRMLAYKTWRVWSRMLFAAAIVSAYSYFLMSRPRMPHDAPPHPIVAASGPLLPSGSIRFISIDAVGTVWFRIANANGAADRVVAIDRDNHRHDFVNLRAVIDARHDDIVRLGSLLDFWAVDKVGRVWTGPRFRDATKWVEVARDRSYPGGSIALEERVVIDADGTAWEPYRITRRVSDGCCPQWCRTCGIQGFWRSDPGDHDVGGLRPDNTRSSHRSLHRIAPRRRDGQGSAQPAYTLPSGTPDRVGLVSRLIL